MSSATTAETSRQQYHQQIQETLKGKKPEMVVTSAGGVNMLKKVLNNETIKAEQRNRHLAGLAADLGVKNVATTTSEAAATQQTLGNSSGNAYAGFRSSSHSK